VSPTIETQPNNVVKKNYIYCQPTATIVTHSYEMQGTRETCTIRDFYLFFYFLKKFVKVTRLGKI
jgi:hypothetical protein